MSGHRRAALALHAVADEDRDLILAQLPAADQQRLRDYLAELAELGIEGDCGGLDLPAAAPAGAALLAGASAPAMFAVLEHEPAALVAQLLALRDWPWAQPLLALYPASRRDAIRSARVVPAPARDRFLLEALAATVAAPAVPVRASLLAPLRRLVAVWNR